MSKNNREQISFKIVPEIKHVGDVGALEAKDALIVIANHENIWLVPIIDEQLYEPVLCSTRILELVNQYI